MVSARPASPPDRFATAVWVVARDEGRRESFRRDLTGLEAPVNAVESGGGLLREVAAESGGCVVVDPDLPDMTGCELLAALHVAAPVLSVVVVAEKPPLPAVVQLMRSGAFDVLEMPVPRDRLREAVAAALQVSAERAVGAAGRRAAAQRLARLTDRQREVLRLAIEGHPNKVIAARTGVSVRTVERQRAATFEALGVTTLTGAVEVLRRAGQDPLRDAWPGSSGGGGTASGSDGRRQFLN